MHCAEVHFSGHALRRMFDRELGRDAVLQVVEHGETIASYPDDKPYPSWLMLGFVQGRPVHVVVARVPDSGICYIVTAYRPNPGRWSPDFRTRNPP